MTKVSNGLKVSTIAAAILTSAKVALKIAKKAILVFQSVPGIIA